MGFRELGFNILFSIVAVLVININFSYPTRLAHSWIPDPLFRVYVDSIYKAKVSCRCAHVGSLPEALITSQHGSDSGIYDTEGRFVPQAFEDMFSKYDKSSQGALSLPELVGLMHGNRCAGDPFGVGPSSVAMRLVCLGS